jgi:hypothetical protein
MPDRHRILCRQKAAGAEPFRLPYNRLLGQVAHQSSARGYLALAVATSSRAHRRWNVIRLGRWRSIGNAAPLGVNALAPSRWPIGKKTGRTLLPKRSTISPSAMTTFCGTNRAHLPRGQMGAMTVSFHRTDKLDAACLSTFERNLASDIRSVHKLPIGLELPLPQCILTAWYVRSVWRVRSNGLDICNQMRQAGRRHFGEMDLVTDPVS